MKFMANALCKLLGHNWVSKREAIRECARCGREEALWYNEFPRVGEPATKWDASPTQRLRDMGELP